MSTATPIKRRRGRPPKQLEGNSETREALVRSGVEILTEKGFSAAGLDEILKKVSVPKGSFYHYFDSKEAFGHELIAHYDQFFARKLDSFLLNEDLKPLDRIQAFVDDAAASMQRFDFRRGCLVGNLGQEMSTLPESYRELLKQVFEHWQGKFETCLKLAKETGYLSPQTDCKQLALTFWIGWEGAVLRSKLEQSPEPLHIFATFFLSNLRN